MKTSARSALFCGITMAGTLLLGACGKKEAPTPATPATAASSAAAPATTAAANPTPPAHAATAPMVPAPAASSPAASGTAAASQAAAPVVALSVAKLTVGDAVNAERQVTHASSSFTSSDKTIYASVATEGRSTGATLNAKWSYLEGTGQLVSSVSQSIATDGPAVTTFKVQNPDLWPEGKYKVEISLDGKAVATQDFEIKKR
jgi:hypothetical protein